MSLALYEHPFAAYCWKPLIALYEREVPFEPRFVGSDALRPPGSGDEHGVAEARAGLDSSYAMLDARLAGGGWMAGADFGLADCAAAPALHYATVVHRWDEERFAGLTRYFSELMARPSVERVVEEAREYRQIFPLPWPEHVH